MSRTVHSVVQIHRLFKDQSYHHHHVPCNALNALTSALKIFKEQASLDKNVMGNDAIKFMRTFKLYKDVHPTTWGTWVNEFSPTFNSSNAVVSKPNS